MNTPFKYTKEEANLYKNLGLANTTYEIGYRHVAKCLGNINNKKVLDFGCGAGRSSEMLSNMGASVVGVDHSQEMLDEASRTQNTDITFTKIDGSLPFEENSFDAAISIAVFIEIRTKDKMLEICKDIYRCLKPNSKFVILTGNSTSYPQKFRSFENHAPQGIKPGEMVECKIITDKGSFIIEDTYWEEQDYIDVLKNAAFSSVTCDYPMVESPEDWETDENRMSPFLIITAVK